jgi:hypothetical protein
MHGVGRNMVVNGLSLLTAVWTSESQRVDPEWISHLPQERLSEVAVALALCVIARASAEVACRVVERGVKGAADYTGFTARFRLPEGLDTQVLVICDVVSTLFTSFCSDYMRAQASHIFCLNLLSRFHASFGGLPTLTCGSLWVLRNETEKIFLNSFHKSPLWTTLPHDWGQNPTRRIFCVLLDTGLSLATSLALARLPRTKILGCLPLIIAAHESLRVFAPRFDLSAKWGDALISVGRIVSSVAIACLTMRVPLSPSRGHVLLAFAVLTPALLDRFRSFQFLFDLMIPGSQISGEQEATDADYELVGITRTTDYAAACHLYRQRALAYHPDKHVGYLEIFKKFQCAWNRIQTERSWPPSFQANIQENRPGTARDYALRISWMPRMKKAKAPIMR